MKTGIAVFAYNRSGHLQQVLDGLQKNKNVDKLYLFQDGLKCEAHRKEWEKVKEVIKNIAWCEVQCSFAEENKGLAYSIVEGINHVLAENDAVIVLEDDCVPAPDFIDFMEQCFKKYQNNKRIYSVSGYSYPFHIRESSESDVYFCGRISSWGWGTWKDRWENYEQDYGMLQRMKKDKEKSLCLALWGRDLEEMLADRVRGNNDSWAVFWALKVIEEGGLCVNPCDSLIQNIGLDGSGVHCGKSDFFDVRLCPKKHEGFLLPDNTEITPETEEAFAPLYGSYTALTYRQKKDRCSALIYGVGSLFLVNEKRINDDYDIVAFVDRNKKGYYAGKKILLPDEIKDYEFDKLVIMIRDEGEAGRVAEDMTDRYGIPEEKIESGTARYTLWESHSYKPLGEGRTLSDKV